MVKRRDGSEANSLPRVLGSPPRARSVPPAPRIPPCTRARDDHNTTTIAPASQSIGTDDTLALAVVVPGMQVDLEDGSEPETVVPTNTERPVRESSERNRWKEEIVGFKNTALINMARELGLSKEVDDIVNDDEGTNKSTHDDLIKLIVEHRSSVKEAEIEEERSRWKRVEIKLKRKAEGRTRSARAQGDDSRENHTGDGRSARHSTNRRVASRETRPRVQRD